MIENLKTPRLTGLFLLLFVAACATTSPVPPTFMRAADDSWNQWLDTVIDAHVTDVRIRHLPLTDAFAGAKLAIARADAPLESLKVSLHANGVTRRQALWLLARKYGLHLSIEHVQGQPSYITVSRP